MNIKELKREIRALRKLKLQCRAGSKERIELHRKMTALKKQLMELKNNTSQENTSPLVYEKKERTVDIIEENHPDSNGCSYFSYCKRINKDSIINHTCYDPVYFMGKLERKCNQLILEK